MFRFYHTKICIMKISKPFHFKTAFCFALFCFVFNITAFDHYSVGRIISKKIVFSNAGLLANQL